MITLAILAAVLVLLLTAWAWMRLVGWSVRVRIIRYSQPDWKQRIENAALSGSAGPIDPTLLEQQYHSDSSCHE